MALSANDRLTLVEHVNIVIHCAASLDFEADLKSTVNINLLGTRRVVLISQEIRDLKVVFFSKYSNNFNFFQITFCILKILFILIY